MGKRSQVGVEYIIIVGFVTMAIISIVVLAYFYSGQIKDKIRLNQVESFAFNLVSSAEVVFFAGEPSKTTISLYLPEGVVTILVAEDEDAIVITTQVSGGRYNTRAFYSKVPLNASSPISTSAGIKNLVLEAEANYVMITQQA